MLKLTRKLVLHYTVLFSLMICKRELTSLKPNFEEGEIELKLENLWHGSGHGQELVWVIGDEC